MANMPHTINGRPSIVVKMEEVRDWVKNSDLGRLPYRNSEDPEERKLALRLHSLLHYTLKNYDRFSDAQKEEYDKMHPEVSEVKRIYEETMEIVDTHLKTKMNSYKQYFADNGVDLESQSDEQRKVYESFMKINNEVLFLYDRGTLEGKKEMLRKHPDIEEALSLSNEIYRRNSNLYMLNFLDIKEEIKKAEGDVKKATLNGSRIGFEYLRNKVKAFTEPYMSLKTPEEREQYMLENPGLVKPLEMFKAALLTEEMSTENAYIPKYIKRLETIKEGMISEGLENLSSRNCKTPKAKELKESYNLVSKNLISKYESLSENERMMFLRSNPDMNTLLSLYYSIEVNPPSRFLKKARLIESWKKDHPNVLPQRGSKDKLERDCYSAILYINDALIAPYRALQTEEEQKKFREEHKDFDAVEHIVRAAEFGVVPKYVACVDEIYEWVDEHRALPRKDSTDAVEKRMARNFMVVREKILNPYFRALRQRDENAKIKHLAHFPETREIFDKVHRIFLEYGTTSQKNLFLKIQVTIEKQEELERLRQEEERRIKEGREKLKSRIKESSKDR
ncbi:MAG: hypothetical protein IJS47_04415 [Clostridia bacterium]|nr:hypothetical protein [Clostridia bacterium]